LLENTVERARSQIVTGFSRDRHTTPLNEGSGRSIPKLPVAQQHQAEDEQAKCTERDKPTTDTACWKRFANSEAQRDNDEVDNSPGQPEDADPGTGKAFATKLQRIRGGGEQSSHKYK